MRIIGTPNQNDGLIRHWLSLRGLTAAGVSDGVIWTRNRRAAIAMERKLDCHWLPEAPRPMVDWPRDDT